MFSELATLDCDYDEDLGSPDHVLDFYVSDQLTDDHEENSRGPLCKKRRGLKSAEYCDSTSRKFKCMQAFELRRILDDDCIQFCQEAGLLAATVTCSCGKPMVFTHRLDGPERRQKEYYVWKCRKGKRTNRCKSQISIRKGTWFENSKLSISEILWIMYMWFYDYSYNSILHECEHSAQTVLEWLSACQDVCQAIMECKNEPLGGLNKVIEIFECKFSCAKDSKYQWVFCALEQYSCNSVLVIVQDKKSKSLVQLFDQYIVSNSKVVTNFWGSFENLTSDDFTYFTQQKSITFFDTVCKIEIKDVETLREVATRTSAINFWTKYEYGPKFCELMYRKSLSFSQDAFLTFLQDVAKIYAPVSKHSKS